MHLVQAYPLPGFLMKATSFGGTGVHVFILCSGFGLYLSSLHKPLKYGKFLKSRFSKVYIPYVLVVLISALYFGIVCGQDVLMPLLGSVFLFKMLYHRWSMPLVGRCGLYLPSSSSISFGH